MRRILGVLIIASLASSAWVYADDITFTAGSTKVNMRGEDQEIELSSRAKITTGQTVIEADTVRISGKGNSLFTCSGNVSVVDGERGVSIQASNLFYDRDKEVIVIDGWGEVEDVKNEVSASAMWLEFDLNAGLIQMHLAAKVIKSTKEGAMVCRSSSLKFDRDKERLELTGGAKVNWKGDDYSAESISVDLKTERIEMNGQIKGTVHA